MAQVSRKKQSMTPKKNWWTCCIYTQTKRVCHTYWMEQKYDANWYTTGDWLSMNNIQHSCKEQRTYTQCAAVRTHRLLITDPPHVWKNPLSPRLWIDACQHQEFLRTISPPTIRLKTLGLIFGCPHVCWHSNALHTNTNQKPEHLHPVIKNYSSVERIYCGVVISYR